MMALSGRIESDQALIRYRQLLRRRLFTACPTNAHGDRTVATKIRARSDAVRRFADATR